MRVTRSPRALPRRSRAKDLERKASEAPAEDAAETLPFEATLEADPAAPTPEAEVPADSEALVDTAAFLKGLVEAILFVSDRPLSLKELARAAKIDKKRAGELVLELQQDYAGRGFGLTEVAGGLALRTSAMFASYVRNFIAQRPVRLSRPQLETLAIVAYRPAHNAARD